MRILVLVVLAVIAYLLYKKFTAKSADANPALDNATGSEASATREIGSGATEAAAAAGKSAVESSGETATQTAADTSSVVAGAAASLVPDTGNALSDIQEMFKILNLRPSDASRLDITAEQYASLKSGQAADLSSDAIENIVGRLKGML